MTPALIASLGQAMATRWRGALPLCIAGSLAGNGACEILATTESTFLVFIFRFLPFDAPQLRYFALWQNVVIDFSKCVVCYGFVPAAVAELIFDLFLKLSLVIAAVSVSGERARNGNGVCGGVWV